MYTCVGTLIISYFSHELTQPAEQQSLLDLLAESTTTIQNTQAHVRLFFVLCMQSQGIPFCW